VVKSVEEAEISRGRYAQAFEIVMKGGETRDGMAGTCLIFMGPDSKCL
jgi:hypothetical protein